MGPDDVLTLINADRGNAEAQDAMGEFFLAGGRADIGAWWLTLAAAQSYPNAMQTLGQCYASGRGVKQDENLALMWIAKAAANGHAIARIQSQGLRGAAFGGR
jgi:TPR repeat protein